MTATPLTARLAAHVDGIALDRTPPDVILKAKVCVLDAIGCALAGASHGAIRSLLEAARPQPVDEGEPGASVWRAGLRTAPPTAALVNASMAHVVNADDAHKESMGHPGAVVIPAALVVGEMVGAPGAAVLEAVIAGYECLLRVGIGVGVASHRDRGWYATSSLGPFGAAASAAKLLKLGEDGMAGAIGHAGAQASGLWAFTADGSLANLVYVGRAAESGVLGALLVKSGLSGPTRVLEAEDGGFLRAMSDASDPERILADLGRHFMILDVSLKPYPSSRTTHAAIDACLAIRARQEGRPGWLDRLSRIVVRTYAVAKRQADIPEPATEWMASLSIPYTAAVALVEGTVGVEHFTSSRFLDSPRVRAVMRKVEVVVDESITAAFPAKWSCRVEAIGTDGTREVESIESARGDPKNPMPFDEVKRKFHTLTSAILDRAAGERICACVEGLDHEPNVRELALLLREAGRA
ncbi:MAG TPA: MmgE/PrpD family protein [Candidatus Methylomirabilis sp.]|nr:MmgE/PrpD family protein [Candidatus Methylomirabilis sp.]